MSGFPVGTTTVQSEVHDAFTPDGRALLDTITRPDPPDSGPSLLPAVAAWGFEVRIFAGQLDRSYWEPEPKIWGAYDLVGTMFHRDRVERMLPAVPHQLAEQVQRVLAVYDTEFRGITVDDERGEMTHIGDVEPDRPGWWWHRIPDRGPVREDLDQQALSPTILATEIRPRFTVEQLAVLDTIPSNPDHYWDRLLNTIAAWAASVHVMTHLLTDPALRTHYPTQDPPGLLNRLKQRDSIHRLLPQVPPPLLPAVLAVLDTYDEQYRAITIPDDSGRLPRAARITRNPVAWWWHRTPAGPAHHP